jgi:hypothetical protein
MDMKELGLIKDIIEAAVEKAVKPLNEELKKIKAIAATTLKENRERPAAQPLQEAAPLFKQLPKVNAPILEHRQTKTEEDIKREASRLVAFSNPEHGLAEMEVSEDLIFSMLKPR